MAPVTEMRLGGDLPTFTDEEIRNHKTSHDAIPEQEEAAEGSPLNMPPGQIHGLEALKLDGHSSQRGQSPRRRFSNGSSLLHIDLPRFPSPSEIALSALQYLPYPVIVLNGFKTLVMANGAMGRLLGLEDNSADHTSDDGNPSMDDLRGQSLSQLGIDMTQEGRPIWVTWESFLDGLADDTASSTADRSDAGEGDQTPTNERTEPLTRASTAEKNSATVHDAVVEVVITHGNVAPWASSRTSKSLAGKYTHAKMIITVFEIEDEKFFTLSFTSTETTKATLPSSKGQPRKVHFPGQKPQLFSNHKPNLCANVEQSIPSNGPPFTSSHLKRSFRVAKAYYHERRSTRQYRSANPSYVERREPYDTKQGSPKAIPS
jgi:hypothetical protein